MKSFCIYCEEEFNEEDLLEIDYYGFMAPELSCEPCLQGRWERQQEKDMEAPPPSMQEQYRAAWQQKLEAKG
jgi:hypothetical protein